MAASKMAASDLVILLTLNKSKIISSHFADFKQVKIFSNQFVDYKQVKKLVVIFAEFEQVKNLISFC